MVNSIQEQEFGSSLLTTLNRLFYFKTALPSLTLTVFQMACLTVGKLKVLQKGGQTQITFLYKVQIVSFAAASSPIPDMPMPY